MSASTENGANPRLALVLGAGGTKGWAHLAVLRLLHEAGVPIGLIVGASAGALIGPLYAARRDPIEAERVAMSFTPTDFLAWFLRDLRLALDAGRMGRRLWESYGRLDFSELAVPFAAVGLELESGQPRLLRSGSVGRAVEASIRPPLVSRPVRIDGRSLVDGGLQNAAPVWVAREMGARAVVSVNVGELLVIPRSLRPLSARVGAACRARSRSPDDVAGQIGFVGRLMSQSRRTRQAPDFEVRPDMRGVSSMWPWHIEKAYRRGEAAARRALPDIQRLLAARAA